MGRKHNIQIFQYFNEPLLCLAKEPKVNLLNTQQQLLILRKKDICQVLSGDISNVIIIAVLRYLSLCESLENILHLTQGVVAGSGHKIIVEHL